MKNSEKVSRFLDNSITIGGRKFSILWRQYNVIDNQVPNKQS